MAIRFAVRQSSSKGKAGARPFWGAMDEFDVPEGLEEAMNGIGVAALSAAGDPDARVLLYAEVREDMEQMLLRYMPPGEDKLRCALEFDEAADAVRDAWEISRSAGPRLEWRAILYQVEGGKMRVELLYDEDVDEDLTFYEKELELLERHFPGVDVVPVELPGAVELTLAKRPFWRFWR